MNKDKTLIFTTQHVLFLEEVRKGLHPDFCVDSFGKLEFIGQLPLILSVEDALNEDNKHYFEDYDAGD